MLSYFLKWLRLSLNLIFFNQHKPVRVSAKSFIYSFIPRRIKEMFATYSVMKYLDLLEKQGMEPFIVGGSSLAILREKRLFLKHDTDFDFGILLKNWKPDIKDILERSGYKIIAEFGTPEKGYNLSVTMFGFKIDLFIFYKSRDQSWDCIWIPDKNGVRQIRFHTYPIDTFDARKFVMIKGKKLPVPDKLLQYIEAAYGPDWRIPVKNWDWTKDHYCNDINFKPF